MPKIQALYRAWRRSGDKVLWQSCSTCCATTGPTGVQRWRFSQLKSALSARSPKTVNNVLTVLNVLMRTAVEWNMSERVQCSIKMLRTPKGEAGFCEFDQFERLVEASARESQMHLVVLLGGEAGLRCGEMIGLEWTDVDLEKRQLCVARSEWRGQ